MQFRYISTVLFERTTIALLLLAVSTTFAQSGTETEPTDTSGEIQLLIEEAIGLGVPLYNAGQAEACLSIYRVALRALLLLAPEQIDGEAVERALSAAAEESPTRGAWTLRYMLDELLQTGSTTYMTADNLFRIDFNTVEDAKWYPVNDNVMGGISRGNFSLTENRTGEFLGQLSMQNNGGFSSIRTSIDNGRLAGSAGVDLRVRGDGREYTLLAAPSNMRGSWQQKFIAPEQWQTIRIPFATMELSVRGMKRPFAPSITGNDIGMLGFLIADKQTRPFRMEIDWIQSYTNEVGSAQ